MVAGVAAPSAEVAVFLDADLLPLRLPRFSSTSPSGPSAVDAAIASALQYRCRKATRGGKVKLYAELPKVRARQIAFDVVAAAVVVLSVRAGAWLHGLVAKLAAPGQAIQDSGQAVAGSLDRVAETIGEVPVAGVALRSPFAAAADAGRTLAEAGQAQQQAALTFALWLGVLVAFLGVMAVFITYVPQRVAWVREASAAARLRSSSADLRIFAYRAAVARPLTLLSRAVPDPGAALAAEEFDALATVELEALGLRR